MIIIHSNKIIVIILHVHQVISTAGEYGIHSSYSVTLSCDTCLHCTCCMLPPSPSFVQLQRGENHAEDHVKSRCTNRPIKCRVTKSRTCAQFLRYLFRQLVHGTRKVRWIRGSAYLNVRSRSLRLMPCQGHTLLAGHIWHETSSCTFQTDNTLWPRSYDNASRSKKNTLVF